MGPQSRTLQPCPIKGRESHHVISLSFPTASSSPGLAKSDTSTLPNDTVASPYRSPTPLFLCTTAQCSLCPQRHFRYHQVQAALTPEYHCVPSDTCKYQQVQNGSYANFHCVPSDTLSTNRYKTALTPTFIVSPATHQVVLRHEV